MGYHKVTEKKMNMEDAFGLELIAKNKKFSLFHFVKRYILSYLYRLVQ